MTLTEFANMPHISFTVQAANICTPAQLTAIVKLCDDGSRKMKVFVDFSLPDGYLYFIRFDVKDYDVKELHGGIDTDGIIST